MVRLPISSNIMGHPFLGNSFFSKLRKVAKFYWVSSIAKTKEYKGEKMDLRAKLKVATTRLHDVIYNMTKQGKVWEMKITLEGIESRQAKGAIINAIVKEEQSGR